MISEYPRSSNLNGLAFITVATLHPLIKGKNMNNLNNKNDQNFEEVLFHFSKFFNLELEALKSIAIETTVVPEKFTTYLEFIKNYEKQYGEDINLYEFYFLVIQWMLNPNLSDIDPIDYLDESEIEKVGVNFELTLNDEFPVFAIRLEGSINIVSSLSLRELSLKGYHPFIGSEQEGECFLKLSDTKEWGFLVEELLFECKGMKVCTITKL
jgi:hypothetical protein